MLERCLGASGGLTGGLIGASVNVVSLKPLQEGLLFSRRFSAVGNKHDDLKYRPKRMRSPADQATLLDNIIQDLSRAPETFDLVSVVRDVESRTHCMVVRCDAVFRVR